MRHFFIAISSGHFGEMPEMRFDDSALESGQAAGNSQELPGAEEKDSASAVSPDEEDVPGAGIESDQEDQADTNLDGKKETPKRDDEDQLDGKKAGTSEEGISFGSEALAGDKKPKGPQDPHGWWQTAKEYGAWRLAALVAGVSLIGYGAYKGSEKLKAWWQSHEQGAEQTKLTLKERDILLSLIDAMAEDIEHARAGKKEPSVVKQFDIAGLNESLAAECTFMQRGFIELYNQCDEQGNNVDTLELFYNQFSEVVRSVVSQAEIVSEQVQEATA